MNVQTVMSTPVVKVPAVTPIAIAAKLMSNAGVGALVVVDDDRLVGIVTDRDIVIRAVAAGIPLTSRVDCVMTPEVQSVRSDAQIEQAYETFRRVPFRRLPVVNGESTVVGMLTLDDLVLDLTRRITDLAAPVADEIMDPRREMTVPPLC